MELWNEAFNMMLLLQNDSLQLFHIRQVLVLQTMTGWKFPWEKIAMAEIQTADLPIRL